jgi:hypothetical protein
VNCITEGENMLTVSKAGKKDIEEMCLLLQELFTLEKDFTPREAWGRSFCFLFQALKIIF